MSRHLSGGVGRRPGMLAAVRARLPAALAGALAPAAAGQDDRTRSASRVKRGAASS
jgi:hypothetical protein